MSRRGVVVLTGAGISADSGIPTFRGPDGLWEGRRIEDVATPEGWRRDPPAVWRFYQARRAALAHVKPNAAHVALAAFARRAKTEGVPFLLVTQNVDDLHERAGSDALHMHGELLKLRCEICDDVVEDRVNFNLETFVPCRCGHARLRPDVVWFGEIPYRMDEIFEALETCGRFLALGTSGAVYPAAGFLRAARAAGAKTYVQSLEEPANLHPRDDFRAGRAVDVVPRLLDEI